MSGRPLRPRIGRSFREEGLYDYIDESAKQVTRNTELNDGDIDIGGNENIFSAALRQLNAGSAGDAVVIQLQRVPRVNRAELDWCRDLGRGPVGSDWIRL